MLGISLQMTLRVPIRQWYQKWALHQFDSVLLLRTIVIILFLSSFALADFVRMPV